MILQLKCRKCCRLFDLEGIDAPDNFDMFQSLAGGAFHRCRDNADGSRQMGIADLQGCILSKEEVEK